MLQIKSRIKTYITADNRGRRQSESLSIKEDEILSHGVRIIPIFRHVRALHWLF